MKNKYIPTAAGLYLNYLIHGMGVLLITLNMAHLQEQWGTDKAGVSIVISSLGIGKLATIVTGFLSDRFGRKPFIYLGILSYLIFFRRHPADQKYLSGLRVRHYGGPGEQLPRLRYLSGADGIFPALCQPGQRADQSLRLCRAVPVAVHYQLPDMGKSVVRLVVRDCGSALCTERDLSA